MSKYDPYFNQWDELDSSEYEWHPPSENMDDPDMVNAEPWQVKRPCFTLRPVCP